MGYASWNQGLLLAALLSVIAGMALVSARSSRERLLAIGVLVQAILVAFVANGTFHGRSELSFGGLALLLMFPVWSLPGSGTSCGQNSFASPLDTIPAHDSGAEER